MTVEELIEKLSFCDLDEEVTIAVETKNDYITSCIDDLELCEDGVVILGRR